MNLEQREILLGKIHKLEGLFAHAIEHGDMDEAKRIERKLVEVVEEL
jgi:hypothetical protein